MSQIQTLKLHQFRSFKAANFDFSSGINCIAGINATGKTSILEAIWCAFNAQSFRTSNTSDVIQSACSDAQLHLKCNVKKVQHSIGFQRRSERSIQLWNDTLQHNALSLSQLLPTLFIGPDSVRVLAEEPALRRRFLDRALFFQTPDYLPIWRTYKRALNQRNHCLRQHQASMNLQAWNQILINSAEALEKARRAYLDQYITCFKTILQTMIPDLDADQLTLIYTPGYGRNLSYAEALERQLSLDLKQKFTRSGPHRADIEILIDKTKIANRMSRGQLKAATFALYFAQVLLLKQQQTMPLILIDDFSSEIDPFYRESITRQLIDLQMQTLITTVDSSLVQTATNVIQLERPST